jgi:hypothetical protein
VRDLIRGDGDVLGEPRHAEGHAILDALRRWPPHHEGEAHGQGEGRHAVERDAADAGLGGHASREPEEEVGDDREQRGWERGEVRCEGGRAVPWRVGTSGRAGAMGAHQWTQRTQASLGALGTRVPQHGRRPGGGDV